MNYVNKLFMWIIMKNNLYFNDLINKLNQNSYEILAYVDDLYIM